MAKYLTETIGEYARMLREDALHALNKERRVFDEEGRMMWEYEPGTDQADIAEEVDEVIRELAHYLKEALEDGRTREEISKRHGMKFVLRDYMEERAKQARMFEDDWAWVYEEQEGML